MRLTLGAELVDDELGAEIQVDRGRLEMIMTEKTLEGGRGQAEALLLDARRGERVAEGMPRDPLAVRRSGETRAIRYPYHDALNRLGADTQDIIQHEVRARGARATRGVRGMPLTLLREAYGPPCGVPGGAVPVGRSSDDPGEARGDEGRRAPLACTNEEHQVRIAVGSRLTPH